MQNLARNVARVTLLALAGCAQAPDLDEAFLTTGAQDDAALQEAGVLLDAGPGGTLGGAGPGGLGGFDASGPPAALGGTGAGPGGALAGIDSGPGVIDAAADSASSVPDTSVGPIIDTGTPAVRDAAQGGPEAGGGTTGGGTTGGGSAGGGTPGGGASCNPASCNNECFLLERCCDENNQCACLTPLSRQCTLPSL